MPHETNAYQCDFCNRVFRRTVDAVNHERACKHNPARRTCYTCKLYQMGDYTDTIPPMCVGDRPIELSVVGMICTKHSKPIEEQPYYIDCDANPLGEPLPGTCDWYEPNKEADCDSTRSSE